MNDFDGMTWEDLCCLYFLEVNERVEVPRTDAERERRVAAIQKQKDYLVSQQDASSRFWERHALNEKHRPPETGPKD